MADSQERRDILDDMITEAVDVGLMHHTTEDESLTGRTIILGGKELLYFGSCSYLGLELDARLKRGAAEAAWRYGTQFSSSRAYLSATPYTELEALFEQIFDAPVIVTPTTTLGHLAALPTLVEPGDVLIFDQQVHQSVQTAMNLCRLAGATVEILRHNRMDILEQRLEALSREGRRRVWYLADGVYSMYGDLMPAGPIRDLLDRYERFYVYVDDAHGMSWQGSNGRGVVLGEHRIHERMVVATSLAKGFGVGGGVLIFPNAEWRRKVRTCGGPMIFSGPIQPPSLGAAIASARIHLSPEIDDLQAKLQLRLRYCNELLAQHGLPVVSSSEAPIRFIGMGLPRVAYAMVRKLMADGFFTNVAMFPAVPMRRAGVRFTLTNHLSLEEIRGLVEAIARHLPDALEEEGGTLEGIHKAFGLTPAVAFGQTPSLARAELRIEVRPALTLRHETSIDRVPERKWDHWLGKNGVFSWEGLRFLESTFKNRPEPENNWNFHYYTVEDKDGHTVLATFFTDALWKDDMLEPEGVSRAVEAERREDPRFLVSRVLAMGSLLTEGQHLHLDRERDWQGAMRLLLDAVRQEQERCGATSLVLRDFPEGDAEFEAFIRRQGFVKSAMPETLVAECDWKDEEEFLERLSYLSRKHQRRQVLPWAEAFDVEVLRSSEACSPTEWAHLHELYRNVKQASLELNTFELPADFFERLASAPNWEILVWRLRPEHGGSPQQPAVGVMAAYVGEEQYVPLVCGLDYAFVRSHGLYRQVLRQATLRARHHGRKRLLFGFGAALEKRRFGALPQAQCLYLQANDHYNLEVLAKFRADLGAGRRAP